MSGRVIRGIPRKALVLAAVGVLAATGAVATWAAAQAASIKGDVYVSPSGSDRIASPDSSFTSPPSCPDRVVRNLPPRPAGRSGTGPT